MRTPSPLPSPSAPRDPLRALAPRDRHAALVAFRARVPANDVVAPDLVRPSHARSLAR